MKKRHVRMVLPRCDAVFNARRCQIFDLSVTGALLQLDYPPEIGSVSVLVVQAAADVLRLDAVVVRVKAVQSNVNRQSLPPQWTAGVAFLDASAVNQKLISRFYPLILEESKKKPR